MKMMLNTDGGSRINEHNGDYCCDRMKQAFLSNDFSLGHEKRFAQTSCERRDGGVYWCWDYCPFCGKMIKDKLKEYEKVLKQELRINDPWDDSTEDEIPEEFKTDEWWRKRGL